ncbi:MAG: hypothetical protein ACI4AL_07945 [Aristaeellaceae bacterium]
MKKNRIAILTCLLALLLVTPALAQTTGVNLDGKSYAFFGGPGTYVVDGTTFVIDGDSVTVQRPGEAELVLPLVKCEDDAIVTESTSEAVSEVTITTAAEDAVVAQYTQSALSEDEFSPEAFSVYAPFGLSCDSVGEALYYRGRRVRIFEDVVQGDALQEEAGLCYELEYVDSEGAVDVRTVRDEAGTLLRLEQLSEAEFQSRDLKDWTEPEIGVTAAEGNVWTTYAAVEADEDAVAAKGMTAETSCADWTPAEKQEFFAEYAPFGLTYDPQTDALTYMGRAVHNFLDVRSSNGVSLTGGSFRGSITQISKADGEVDVETIRDYDHPNASGEGTLTGIVVTEKN